MLPLLLGTLGGPLLQGALAGTALGALSATQLGAGIAGLTSLAQGNDILTAGLDAFGGYGGAGGISSLMKSGQAAAGAIPVTPSAGASMKNIVTPISETMGVTPSSSTLMSGAATPPLPQSLQTAASQTLPQMSAMDALKSGVSDLFSPGGAGRFAEATGSSALTSLGLPAANLALQSGALMPPPMGTPQQSFGFGPFTPIAELRNKNQEKMGYAEGGIAALNPMHGMFDARRSLPEYREPLGGYKKGGFLNGPGDGMSDDIPATIEGKQPARLADGEFVVPADVVSHLGNGSTKAGAQRLYAMMDKVRKARTGTTKQGKQIKPEKYMPA